MYSLSGTRGRVIEKSPLLGKMYRANEQFKEQIEGIQSDKSECIGTDKINKIKRYAQF